MVNWRCGEEAADIGMRPPHRVSDDLATAEVLDGESQFAVPLIGLQQCGRSVRPPKLVPPKQGNPGLGHPIETGSKICRYRSQAHIIHIKIETNVLNL